MPRLRLDNVCVDFPVLGHNRTLRKRLFQMSRRIGGDLSAGPHKDTIVVNALKNISLELTDGARLGLVGPNGAGKTTLLRVFAGVYPPTGGAIRIEGRVSALFNTALGMDLDDTGLDNIRSIGLFLGLTPDEIEARIEDIAAFSELGEYLTLPVRTYSSGMLTRLSFSLVTTIEPEILLLDEGIGAGDARFAKRAEERIKSFYSRSRIMVLASHSEELMRNLCSRALLLDKGAIVADGGVEEVWERYRGMIAG